MRTLTASTTISRIIAGSTSDRSFSPSFQKNCFLHRRIGVSFLRFRKFASSGFFHLESERHGGIVHVSALSSKSQVAEIQTTEAQNQEIYQSKTVRVKFQLQRRCMFGEQFLMVGNDPIFGLWDPSNAAPLNWTDGHLWIVELDIPIGKSIQFKFILKGQKGDIWWQPGPDRIFQAWETHNAVVVCEDWDSAESQKITEEPIENQNASSLTVVDSEALVPNFNQDGAATRAPELVPGLIQSQKARDEEVMEGEIIFDGASGAQNRDIPEIDSTEDPVSDMYSAEDYMLLYTKIKEKLSMVKIDDAILKTDLHWGRKTLQAFLSKLGIFYHQM